MYESYTDILYNLYELIPIGGYFICDDCPDIKNAQRACDDFRSRHAIDDRVVEMPVPELWKLHSSTPMGTYWRKAKDVKVDYDFYVSWNKTRHFNA
mmetsp:Transcript_101174/g.166279  ORF Transcript_101174/g.166279 Transcript_101174/m.166279 type:complete len:96 (-) Transcript_101174:204-491(-)